MAQEMERNRIARDLHDGPAQLMANIVLRTDICRRHINTDPEKCDSELVTIKDLVNESLNEIRRFIFDLRPMTLADLGLATTVKRYIQNTRTGWNANIEFIPVGEEVELDPDLALTVFRICQEALNNAKKHSDASNVWVTLAYEKEAVRLIIEDNGVGFTPEYVNQDRPTPPLGLVSMQERAEVVGATIEIESTANKGTRVELVVPIREEDLVKGRKPRDA
jgi:two-component system sensor histidine kinase DegS